MTKIKIIALLFTVFALGSYAQTPPFQIAIEPMSIPELGGLQSYAFGQHDGKWLIIGGRLDGLHQRQPFAAFNTAGNNNALIVVDPVAQQKWSAPLSALPVGMREQLSSTNMEFFQEGDYLYVIGGYGYSDTAGDHITYSNLSAVHVPDAINAIINGTPYETSFRQITDPMLAVTGGYLNKIYDTFYLTGGQKFIGRYNPMGPDHGPGFIQEYTNSSRQFTLVDNGVDLTVTHLPAIEDAANLHRRDFNVVPQIMPSGQEGITAFSGVFQVDANLPFLNCVNIDSSGYSVNNDFSQYLNHYHCAHVPIYSAANNEMHTLFFGGIAQYYENEGELIQDDNVPFVNTIARVTRDAEGVMAEYKLPVEMPSLLGAGSEFITDEDIPLYSNGVLKIDEFIADTTLIGYIYGGISSTAANIFFTNTGTQSSASSQIFKVYIIKNILVGVHNLNEQSSGTLHMQIFPNPNNGDFTVKFNLKENSEVQIKIQDGAGKLIENEVLKGLKVGENSYSNKIENVRNDGLYYITIKTSYEKATQKIIIAH